jgi:hypothetical protein
MALLGIVAVAIAVLRPAPLHRVEGPVDVFLTESGGEHAAVPQTRLETPRVASKETARNEVAAARPAAPPPSERAPAAVVASAPEPKLKTDRDGRLDGEAPGTEKVGARKKLAEQAPASVIVSNEPVPENGEEGEARLRQKLSKTENDAVAGPAWRQTAPAPAAVAGQAAGAAGPAAKPSAAQPARSWSVVVRGEGARRWMLRRAPETRPSLASTQASAFRVTLDTEGRVTSVRSLDPAPVPPALYEFVRGLVFAPVAAVADGTTRDEKAKDGRTGALQERTAEYVSEIDVEVSIR